MSEKAVQIKDDLEKVKESLVKDFSAKNEEGKKKVNLKMVVFVLIIVLAGVGTGYFLSSRQSPPVPVSRDVAKEEITKGMTVGIVDEKTFRDSAEGKLEQGGFDGEGSHHLVRPGGDSQNVYLTSSVVDLDKFIGRQIKVWGETFSAKKSGWLMDVGKVQVQD